MKRRGFFRTLACAVAAPAIQVCGIKTPSFQPCNYMGEVLWPVNFRSDADRMMKLMLRSRASGYGWSGIVTKEEFPTGMGSIISKIAYERSHVS